LWDCNGDGGVCRPVCGCVDGDVVEDAEALSAAVSAVSTVFAVSAVSALSGSWK
jgi:hypothetical protein